MALKKRELKAVADNFSWEERDAMQQKWDAMDVMDAEEAITSLDGELQAEVTESTEGETGAV
jgi:hypothetical protein